ncbi:MAG: hypothetical protein AAGA17_18110 [Actinomycetota bacterium]
MRARRDRGRGDDGEAGVVLLPLALLAVFGFGLLGLGLWRVTETDMAVVDAARSGARSYVESPVEAGAAGARDRAAAAALRSADAAGLDGVDVDIAASDRVRCSVVEVTVSARVPAMPLPWIGSLSETTVSSTQRQVIDPHRDGLEGEAWCVDG